MVSFGRLRQDAGRRSRPCRILGAVPVEEFKMTDMANAVLVLAAFGLCLLILRGMSRTR